MFDYAFDEMPTTNRTTNEIDKDDIWDFDDDIRTDGGIVIGFIDLSHSQPWGNLQRMYTVDEPHITRPLVCRFSPATGFYTFNGENALSFPPNQKKEQICGCFEKIRALMGRGLLVSSQQ
jgi:hypothetical protein